MNTQESTLTVTDPLAFRTYIEGLRQLRDQCHDLLDRYREHVNSPIYGVVSFRSGAVNEFLSFLKMALDTGATITITIDDARRLMNLLEDVSDLEYAQKKLEQLEQASNEIKPA